MVKQPFTSLGDAGLCGKRNGRRGSATSREGTGVMGWSRLLLLVGILAAGTASARAADMPGLPPPLLPPRVIDANVGWYLRGDIGYGWGTIGGAQSPAPFPEPTDNSIGNGFVGGGGAGFKSQWLRTDVTVDYTAPLKYQGTVLSSGDTTAKVDAVTALFNGYFDLGTWYRATPYIGAGIGAAQMHVTDYSAPFASGSANSQWKLAWALMGGVGYPVAPNLMVDVGYRYMNFGDMTVGSDAGAMTLKNLAAHEVRVGVRWSFDDFPVPH
jgi:opacity protein-like surface antigen